MTTSRLIAAAAAFFFAFAAPIAPAVEIADLAGYAVRPESVALVEVGGEQRLLFVEDRYLAEGYHSRNGVHWPLSILASAP